MMKRSGSLLVLCCIILCSCSSISFDRKVQDNNFYSVSDPKIQVEVSPELQYIGKVSSSRYHQNVHGSRRLMVNYNSYLFARIGKDNVLSQGAVIRLDKVRKGHWKSDLFSDVKNRLKSDYVDIDNERYEHFISVRSDIFTGDEMDFIIDEVLKKNVSSNEKVNKISYRGCSIPKCFMVEGFGRRAGAGNDIKLCILYFEDITNISDEFSCKFWVSGDISFEDQERAFKKFLDNRKKNMKILGYEK